MEMEMEMEMEKIQRLESIGVLAGGIAHEYNNILTAILGNISIAKIYIQPTDNIFEFLTEAEKASVRAKDLTMRLITFSTGGAPMRKTAPLSGLIRASASSILTGSNVICECSIQDGLWPAEVDETQITQALNKLIINAVQAMPGGVAIWLEAENVVIEKEELPISMPSGRYIRITVKDQGTGIPKKNIGRIFDPFFTTKNMGNGLGLAITYSIIKRHSGYISVESEQGKGTTFTIYLPASRETPMSLCFTMGDENHLSVSSVIN
ncbi:hypothetical protein JXL19_01820 [bacterium]|nr:hypothetical protein [bacterium]